MKIRILESISNETEGAFGPNDIVDWKDNKEAQVETASKSEEVETATAE